MGAVCVSLRPLNRMLQGELLRSIIRTVYRVLCSGDNRRGRRRVCIGLSFLNLGGPGPY